MILGVACIFCIDTGRPTPYPISCKLDKLDAISWNERAGQLGRLKLQAAKFII
jgi:hypothetical protein